MLPFNLFPRWFSSTVSDLSFIWAAIAWFYGMHSGSSIGQYSNTARCQASRSSSSKSLLSLADWSFWFQILESEAKVVITEKPHLNWHFFSWSYIDRLGWSANAILVIVVIIATIAASFLAWLPIDSSYRESYDCCWSISYSQSYYFSMDARVAATSSFRALQGIDLEDCLLKHDLVD